MTNRATPATDHQLGKIMGLLVVKDMDSQDLQVMDNPRSRAMACRVTKAMGNSTHRAKDKETLQIMVGQAVRTMDSQVIRVMDNQVAKDMANHHHSNSMEGMAILATSTAAIHHLQHLPGKLKLFAFIKVWWDHGILMLQFCGMVGDVLEIILVTSTLYAVACKLQVGGDMLNL